MRLNGILPPETTTHESRLILSGGNKLLIEGHQGLLSYDTVCIKARLKNALLACSGENLVIRQFSQDDILIEGAILSLELQR